MGKVVGRFRQARLDYQSRTGRIVTVDEVAKKVGISRQALSEIENGNALPRYPVLGKLCEFYGLQPGDLLVFESEWMTLRTAAAA